MENEEIEEIIKNVEAEPLKTVTPQKKTRRKRRSKNKKVFKDPFKTFKDCCDNPFCNTIDETVKNIINEKLAIELKKEDVVLAGSGLYTLKYYNVESKLPLDHPLIIFGLASGTLLKGIVEAVENKKKTKKENWQKDNI